MKLTLEIEDEFEFSLLGISCHERDYRLCWALNRELGTEFIKDEAVYPEETNEKKGPGFPTHRFEDEDNLLSYCLIANKSEGNILVQEYPQLDYIFKLSGPYHDMEIIKLKKMFQNIEFVLAVLPITTHSLKSKPRLVF